MLTMKRGDSLNVTLYSYIKSLHALFDYIGGSVLFWKCHNCILFWQHCKCSNCQSALAEKRRQTSHSYSKSTASTELW